MLGPSVLGVVEVDEAVEVIAIIGLGFVLFLAGLEIEFDKLRGSVLRLALAGFAVSFAVALAVALGLSAGGLVETPLLVAIILCATSLGILIPVLKDAGEIDKPFGQLVIAACSIADFGAIILLTLFFSGEGGIGSTMLPARGARGAGGGRLPRGPGRRALHAHQRHLVKLQDTTAQIRVRAAVAAVRRLRRGRREPRSRGDPRHVHRGRDASRCSTVTSVMTHPDFRRKLEAVGFGFFIPVFFVTSGVRFDADALFADASTLADGARVPRGVAARARRAGAALPPGYRAAPDRRGGLMQATSLPFIVAATAIGMELGLMDAAESAALVGAGLVSVLLFPILGLALLRRAPSRRAPPAAWRPRARSPSPACCAWRAASRA